MLPGELLKNNEIITFEKILKKIDENHIKIDKTLLKLAFDFAKSAHKSFYRKSLEPYINHPLNVAYILCTLRLDQNTIIAGLLHDIPEDTNKTLKDIEKNFGKDIAHLVEGITKLGKIKYRGLERYIENLRKMFIAMAQDIRVIFIKFADRLHNLKTLYALERRKQIRIARETLEIYAPIAGRLGINELKSQLEDLSFKYLDPKEFAWVQELIREKTDKFINLLDDIKHEVKEKLLENNIKLIKILGRTKSIYSLYKKLLSHDKDISRIFDIIALRIIVPKIKDCYASLGIIHSLYKPIPERFKDYISQPKPNGYRSIHTTVFAHKQIVEFQIRTYNMHKEAEFGIAAHWYYDEKGSFKIPKEYSWIKEIVKIQKEIKDGQKYLESLKIDVFKDRIFCVYSKR